MTYFSYLDLDFLFQMSFPAYKEKRLHETLQLSEAEIA